jgi:flagellar hook-length control protein FliK
MTTLSPTLTESTRLTVALFTTPATKSPLLETPSRDFKTHLDDASTRENRVDYAENDDTPRVPEREEQADHDVEDADSRDERVEESASKHQDENEVEQPTDATNEVAVHPTHSAADVNDIAQSSRTEAQDQRDAAASASTVNPQTDETTTHQKTAESRASQNTQESTANETQTSAYQSQQAAQPQDAQPQTTLAAHTQDVHAQDRTHEPGPSASTATQNQAPSVAEAQQPTRVEARIEQQNQQTANREQTQPQTTTHTSKQDQTASQQPVRLSIDDLLHKAQQRAQQLGYSRGDRSASERVESVSIRVQPQATAPAVGRALDVNASVQLQTLTGQAGHALTQASTSPATGTGTPTAPVNGLSLAAQGTGRQADGAKLATSAPPTPQTSTADRVVRAMHTMVNQRGGTLSMKLDPPDLGTLRVQMSIARGVVNAQFHTETSQATEVIKQSMPALRSALESQGLQVDKLQVHGPPPGDQQNAANADGQGQDAQARSQQDAADGQSRGRREHHPAADQPSTWREADSRTFDDLMADAP